MVNCTSSATAYLACVLVLAAYANCPLAEAACPPLGSPDTCGPAAVNQYGDSCSCQSGACCSPFGYCGPSSSSTDSQAQYCNANCQPLYGTCNTVGEQLSVLYCMRCTCSYCDSARLMYFAAAPYCPAKVAFVPSNPLGILDLSGVPGKPALKPSAPLVQWCCPITAPVASWTLTPTSTFPPGYFDSGIYIGKIYATCQDGTQLPPLVYGLTTSINGPCTEFGLGTDSNVAAVAAGSSYTYA